MEMAEPVHPKLSASLASGPGGPPQREQVVNSFLLFYEILGRSPSLPERVKELQAAKHAREIEALRGLKISA